MCACIYALVLHCVQHVCACTYALCSARVCILNCLCVQHVQVFVHLCALLSMCVNRYMCSMCKCIHAFVHCGQHICVLISDHWHSTEPSGGRNLPLLLHPALCNEHPNSHLLPQTGHWTWCLPYMPMPQRLHSAYAQLETIIAYSLMHDVMYQK